MEIPCIEFYSNRIKCLGKGEKFNFRGKLNSIIFNEPIFTKILIVKFGFISISKPSSLNMRRMKTVTDCVHIRLLYLQKSSYNPNYPAGITTKQR